MKRTIYKAFAITLAAGLLSAGSVYAAPQQETEEPVSAEQETMEAAAASEVQEAPAEIVIGEETEDAVKFEFVNGTGKDITYLNIQVNDGSDQETEEIKKMQQALIDQGYLDDVADGMAGPKTKAAVTEFREKNGLSAEALMDDEMLALLFGTDGNLLTEDEVIKADAKVIIFYLETEDAGEAEDTGEKEETDKTDTDETDAGIPFDQFEMNVEYTVVFRLAEEDTEYILHTIPLDETVITILLEDEIAYVEYKETDSDNVISTLEAEKAILQQAEASQETGSYEAYDYSSYDTGDYWYEDYSYYDDYTYDDYTYDDYTYDDYVYDDYTYDDYTYEYPADDAPADYTEVPAADDTQTVDGCLADDALLYD